jgi:hypothetical protein
VSVSRSAWRPLAYALLAIPMILLAVDMISAHKWFPAPDTTEVTSYQTLEDGSTTEIRTEVLTRDGEAQRRRETVFGAGLLVAGIAAAAWGIKDLLLPRRILEMSAEGLVLRVSGRLRAVRRYAWAEILEARSGLIEDEGGPAPVLSLRFVDDALLPISPWGGLVDPPWLHLHTTEWDQQAHEIVPMIEAAITPYRRRPAELEEE